MVIPFSRLTKLPLLLTPLTYILVGDAADACFRPRPMGLYGQSRLCVVLYRQAISMASKARLDSELAVKPAGTSN